MAVSLEAAAEYHLTYSEEISFLVAAEFTARIARLLLEKKFPPDVDLLKVDVPSDATVDTPWQLTRVSRQRYYEPVRLSRSWSERGIMGYREAGEYSIMSRKIQMSTFCEKSGWFLSPPQPGLDLPRRFCRT